MQMRRLVAQWRISAGTPAGVRICADEEPVQEEESAAEARRLGGATRPFQKHLPQPNRGECRKPDAFSAIQQAVHGHERLLPCRMCPAEAPADPAGAGNILGGESPDSAGAGTVQDSYAIVDSDLKRT